MKFNEEHYNLLKPLESIWKQYKKSKTVLKIDPKQIDLIAKIQHQLQGIHMNKSCSDCVIDGLIVVFLQYDKYQPNENIKICERVEVGRKRRPRIQN